jgi:hypothetical protein
MGDNLAALVALTHRGDDLGESCRYAHAAEKYAAALDGVMAWSTGADCLVAAYLRGLRASVLSQHAQAPTLPLADALAARQTATDELLLPAAAALQARCAAGTLMPPAALRPVEDAFFRAYRASTTERNSRADGQPSAADAWTQHMGYGTFVLVAQVAVVAVYMAAMHPALWPMRDAADLARLLSFVADALVLLRQSSAAVLRSSHVRAEAQLVGTMQKLESAGVLPANGGAGGAALLARVLREPWEALKRSGTLERRLLTVQGGGVQEVQKFVAAARSAAATSVAAQGGLRACALATCGVREVHAAQFKRCSACNGAIYCGREHQVADWPNHKVACRAARLAATAAAAAAEGGSAAAGE